MKDKCHSISPKKQEFRVPFRSTSSLSLATRNRSPNQELEYGLETDFLLACMYGNEVQIKHILDQGADIHTSSNDGRICLHYACWEENDICDSENQTPVHYACCFGYGACFKQLLRYVIDLDAKDERGENPPDKLGISKTKLLEKYYFYSAVKEKQSMETGSYCAKSNDQDSKASDTNNIVLEVDVKKYSLYKAWRGYVLCGGHDGWYGRCK